MEPFFLTDGVWVFTSVLYQTTSTVIVTDNEIFVVDPNWLPHEVNAIKDFVEQMRSQHKVYLIFTHSDYDHIVGAGAFSQATVIASQAFALNVQRERDVTQAQHFDKSHYINRSYPIVYPEVDIVITHDSQTVHFNDTTLTFYLAPGHTDQGMFSIFEPQGVWVAGDYLSDIEFPLINGLLTEYRQTMYRVDHILLQHAIKFLVPGHGTIETSVPGIYQRRDHALEYLDDIEALVMHDNPFSEAKYRRRYPFWPGIQDWHQENIAHLRVQCRER
ncbi:MAG TPA: MBL fold metallo-hydrolase [Saprospiraceae bacterium]|nr:MBL fold metallo-hydrolase [Saprospiraceae bacterium]